MMHIEHNRFALNGHTTELGQPPFHNDVEEPKALLGDTDAGNWESAWIDLGGEG